MSAPADHDKKSADELDPDEPRTPLWLPLLGLCLFVGALGYLLATDKPDEVSAPAAEPAPAGSAAAEPPAH